MNINHRDLKCYERFQQPVCGTLSDMKSSVVMVAIMLIWDFIFMFLELDLVLYILGYFTFYMSHYSG